MNFFIETSVKEILDFDYILEKIDVITPYGIDFKRQMTPFLPGNEEKLNEELNKTDRFITLIKANTLTFNKLKVLLEHVKDLRNTVKKCTEGHTLKVIELFEVKLFVFILRDIEETIKDFILEIPDDLKIRSIKELEEILDPEGSSVRTFYIYDRYSEELKKIRERKRTIEREIALEKKKIREIIKNELNLNIKPDGEIIVSKADTELIKVLESHPYVRYKSETYMNIKYSIKSTPKVDNLHSELEFLKEQEEREEYKVRTYLSGKIATLSKEIKRNMDAIGRFDFIMAKAYMAMEIGGVKPKITDKQFINIVGGRHLRVEETLKNKEQKYVPISIRIEQGVTCITGANMGGKTVTLKMVGLLTAMAQYGLFVPCKSMELGLRDFIYITSGDLQSLQNGLSTFGAEIRGIMRALENKNQRGLILIDELARGTNPEEGYAISKAVVNYMKRHRCITIITTHYDNVAEGDGILHLQVMGLSNLDYQKLREEIGNQREWDFSLINKYMDYRLLKVTNKNQVPRDALNIARIMGLDEEILKEAERILGNSS